MRLIEIYAAVSTTDLVFKPVSSIPCSIFAAFQRSLVRWGTVSKKSIVERASSINSSSDGSVTSKYLTPPITHLGLSLSLALFVLPANSIMYSLPAVSAGIIVMMAGQIYAAAIRRFPAGRGTSADTSDPLSDVDFYFPFKDLQSQIQSANILCPAPGGPYDTALSLITTNVRFLLPYCTKDCP
ncbi:MAG: hypothetical protein NXY57DRAFT_525435 [Lentinula lateritia]|nr:MAG: hypothetical protein NXY57DRAFT_525435 [Lentinula lateritia]